MHAYLSGNVNDSPWSRVSPADPANAAREAAAALFNAKAKSELQQIEDELLDIAKDYSLLADVASMDAEVVEVHASEASTQEKLRQLEEIEARRANAPAAIDLLRRREVHVSIRLRPAAIQVIEKTLQRVRDEIEATEKEPPHIAKFWGVQLETSAWLLHPLRRLESIIAAKLQMLESTAPENLWIVRHSLVESGAITARAPANSMM